MEIALRQELVNAIPELNNQVYPTNAPETADKPYLVYMRSRTDMEKTLEGYTGTENLGYLFNVMAVKYADMSRLRNQVIELLVDMERRHIGNDEQFYITELDIVNIEEQYEHQLGVNRGIIDFTIYFKKENE